MIELIKALFCRKWEFVPCLSPSGASDELKAFKGIHPNTESELTVIGNTFGFRYKNSF